MRSQRARNSASGCREKPMATTGQPRRSEDLVLGLLAATAALPRSFRVEVEETARALRDVAHATCVEALVRLLVLDLDGPAIAGATPVAAGNAASHHPGARLGRRVGDAVRWDVNDREEQ